MKKTTLCYIRKDGQYLMLFRNKKEADPNEGKWVGIGGKVEPGETPDQCVVREVREETGYTLTNYHFHGVIHFVSDQWEDEDMYLYTGSEFCGEQLPVCNEGELRWIPEEKLMELPMWEGDRCFFKPLTDGEDKISMTLRYEGETLAEVF